MKEKKILIVDDDPDILNIYKHFLKGIVSEIVTTQDPLEVLELLKLQKFDLLLSDVLMPQMNGIELTKKVHDLYPSLPIIVCSEGGSTDAKELVASIVMNKAISFGAVFALKKPFKKATIQEVIKSILEGEIPDQKN